MRQVTQERCDFDKPAEHLAWSYLGLTLSDGSGLMLHPDDAAKWSEHQYRCGFRFDPDCQEIEYHPPRRGDAHWLNPTGVWVPKGTPRKPDLGAPDMEAYTAPERAATLEQMARSGHLPPEAVEVLIAQGYVRPENLAPEPLRRPDPIIDTSAVDEHRAKMAAAAEAAQSEEQALRAEATRAVAKAPRKRTPRKAATKKAAPRKPRGETS